MFVYFIQKKGFLDGNPSYLKDKLTGFVAKGTDKYYSDFLCPLFFAGFANKEEERSAKTNKLLGKVPYLNGGLFTRTKWDDMVNDIANDVFEPIAPLYNLIASCSLLISSILILAISEYFI